MNKFTNEIGFTETRTKAVAVVSFLFGFFIGVWACVLTAERTTWEILPPEPDVFEAYPKEEWNKL